MPLYEVFSVSSLVKAELKLVWRNAVLRDLLRQSKSSESKEDAPFFHLLLLHPDLHPEISSFLKGSRGLSEMKMDPKNRYQG